MVEAHDFHPIKLSVKNVTVSYGSMRVLRNVSMDIPERSVTAIIGPSGCGKSTLLRCFNRMNDTVEGCRVEGSISLGSSEILGKGVDVVSVRRRVGMVFQKPNPFPKSIFDNVAYGPRILGERGRSRLEAIVEQSLTKAALWTEVKERLGESAMALSGGQQQRLCIARALAVGPEVLLLDEPTSALDPMATRAVEELIRELRQSYTLVAVTHNMQQAQRISDSTAFFYLGDLVELGPTQRLFQAPKEQHTKDYVSGVFS